ncbi:energy transducer TonB family protein [Sphingobium cloacae]|uniref:TonB family protein n=1 Tax=Sphingobium cloacae TaxID=120107 RepID=A0A1E1EXT3_9SPHN|nr:energy transducer TonB [Sphingobium cloacae]BAV63076.1 TonB family protein [Sphingobium cloacae]
MLSDQELLVASMDMGNRWPAIPSEPYERSGYRPSANSRWAGLAGTAIIYSLVLVSLLFTASYLAPKHVSSTLTVVNIRDAVPLPKPTPEEEKAPVPPDKPQKVSERPVEPRREEPAPITTPAPIPIQVVPPKTAITPAPEREKTAAEIPPPPRSPLPSKAAPESWEGRVLARLYQYRQYPRMAMVRRQQGVPYIRIVIDRDGKVLSARLERTSGVSELDREAVLLPKRAQPLPKPPADRLGDTIELVVPVEFFIG